MSILIDPYPICICEMQTCVFMRQMIYAANVIICLLHIYIYPRYITPLLNCFFETASTRGNSLTGLIPASKSITLHVTHTNFARSKFASRLIIRH